jgi:hypothetical protein
MEIQVDKLRVFLNNFIQHVTDMQTEYNKNFGVIRSNFEKIDNIIKEQEQKIILNDRNIKSLATTINEEILYYKDRREQPPNLDMYAGGYKTRKPRKTRRTRKPRKTRKTRI